MKNSATTEELSISKIKKKKRRLTHPFAPRVLLGHQELISVLWSNWSRFGLLCCPEEKLDSGSHYRIVIVSWERVAKMRGVDPLANEPNGRGERKKEKQFPAKISSMHTEQEFLLRRQQKLQFLVCFQGTTTNYLPLSQELLHRWKKNLLTAWESSLIYVFFHWINNCSRSKIW